MPKTNRKTKSKVQTRRSTHRRRKDSKPERAIVRVEPPPERPWQLNTEEITIVKNSIAKGATDEELKFCLTVARRYRLDPFKREIWFIPRWDKNADDGKGGQGAITWVPQVGIYGMAHMAARDHKDYGSFSKPEYGPIIKIEVDGKKISGPEWARVEAWKKGASQPSVGEAYFEEYCPRKWENTRFWRDMPHRMIAKCAKAQAIREAYPDLGALYIPEEMDRSGDDYTPGGRRIVGAPTMDYRNRQIEAEVERQKAGAVPSSQNAIRTNMGVPAEDKAPSLSKPAAPKGVQPAPQQPTKEPIGAVTLDWSADEASPIIRGDIANLTPLLEKHCHMTWKGDWWHCQPRDQETIKQMCQHLGYQLTEILPKAEPSSGGFPARAQAPSLSPPENPAATRGGARPQSTGAPAAELMKCKIERSIAGMVGTRPVRDVTVLLADKKKPTYRCWDKKYFEALDKGVGQECLLVLQRNKGWTNIARPISIGSKLWDEEGLPVLEKNREAGGKTLFP